MGIMWSSLVKIQYTELKLSCGNNPIVKNYTLYRLIIYIDGHILWCTHFLFKLVIFFVSIHMHLYWLRTNYRHFFLVFVRLFLCSPIDPFKHLMILPSFFVGRPFLLTSLLIYIYFPTSNKMAMIGTLPSRFSDKNQQLYNGSPPLQAPHNFECYMYQLTCKHWTEI
jgi:hypothetical protein